MDKLAAVAAPPPAATQAEDAEQDVLAICRRLMQAPGLRPDEDLFDAGATSLTLIRILVEVNTRFDTTLTGAELGESATPRALAESTRSAA